MAIIVPIIAKFIDKGLEDAKKEIAGATTTTEKWAAGLDAAAGPAKAITAAMVGFGITLAKNAGGALKSNKKLAASFKAVGYPENAKAAMAYADSLQHVIGVNDEEIQAVMQKLAAFKDVAASQELMAQATQAAADISAAGFGTMESAATALGKALQDPEKNLGALTRVGVTFTKQQANQIKQMAKTGDAAGAQAAIMKQVQSQYSGIAKESASGTEKMKIAWDEAGEAIGTSLAPFLGIAVDLLTKMAEVVGEHPKLFLALGAAITALAVAIMVANVAFKLYTAATTAGTFANKVFALSAKVVGLALKAMGGPIFWIISAIILLAIVIIKNWDKIKEVTKKVWDWISTFLQTTWEKIKGWCKAAWDWIVNIVKKAWSVIKKVLSLNPFIWVLTHLDKVRGWVKTAWDWVTGFLKGVWSKIKGLFSSNPFDKIRGYLDQIEQWFKNTWDAIWAKVQGVIDNIQSALSGIKSAIEKTKAALDKVKPGKSGKGAATASRVFALPVTSSLTGGVPVPQAGMVAARATGGGGVTITVNGALDPDAVARQIRKILDRHDARMGRERGVPRPVAW